MQLNVNISGQLNAESKALESGIRRGDLMRAGSRGVANETRDFYAELEQSRPNKRGWPRQHFWSAVRRSVNNPVIKSPEAATVSIAHVGIRQRVQGGYIRPTGGKKFLTIPATAEAYGKRAREFGNLRFGFAESVPGSGNLAPALVDAGQQRVAFGRRRKDGSRAVKPGEDLSNKVFFWLVRQVYQPADPTALPSEDRLVKAGSAAANEWAQAVTDQANGGAQ